jgi:hypothetical protein
MTIDLFSNEPCGYKNDKKELKLQFKLTKKRAI